MLNPCNPIGNGALLAREIGFLTRDPKTLRLIRNVVYKIAPSNCPVLILGETGTGKELIARAIHENSHRREQILVDVNCAAFSSNLLESELFGHVRGAFTGAVGAKKGKLREANGGTLFLDELGDMSPEMQAKLLRVLETFVVEPVGGDHSTRQVVNLRLVAATSKDLEQLVREGRFRRDLYFRLSGLIVRVPPLRERRGDISLLANHFLTRNAPALTQSFDGGAMRPLSFDEGAVAVLESHTWPGNVRELKGVIEGLAIMADGDTIRTGDLCERLSVSPQEGTSIEYLDEWELHVLKLQRRHRFVPSACGRDISYPGNRGNADRHMRALFCRALEVSSWDEAGAIRTLAGEEDLALVDVVKDRLRKFIMWIRRRLEREAHDALAASLRRQYGRNYPRFAALIAALKEGRLSKPGLLTPVAMSSLA